MRTSMGTGWLLPTRSISRSWTTRKSAVFISTGSSPISSTQIVPPSTAPTPPRPRPIAVTHGRPARVPTDDLSLLVAQRMVLDQEPSILAIPPPQAPFDLERHSIQYPLTALILHSSPVLGVEERRYAPRIRGHQLFHGESRVLQERPVCVKAMAVRAQDHDRLRDGVDDAPQLLFVLAELCFRSLEILDIVVGSVPPNDVALLVA